MTRLLAIIALILLAGCNQPSSDAPEIAAMGIAPSLAAVEPEARKWAEGAYLVGVMGVEAGRDAPRPTDLDASFLDPFFLDADPVVGDGQANHWLLVFAADSKGNRRLEVLVSGLGAVERQREQDARNSGVSLQSTYPITSSISEYLTEAVPTWNQGTGNGPLIWTLENTAGAPTWTLQGAVDSDGRSRSYAFDAATASAITSLTSVDGKLLARNQGSETGTLTVTASVKQFSILFEGGHSKVTFTIEGTGPTEGDFGVAASLPNNETLEMLPGETVIENPMPGVWKLTAAIGALAVTKDYTISWCAPGGAPSEAC